MTPPGNETYRKWTLISDPGAVEIDDVLEPVPRKGGFWSSCRVSRNAHMGIFISWTDYLCSLVESWSFLIHLDSRGMRPTVKSGRWDPE